MELIAAEFEPVFIGQPRSGTKGKILRFRFPNGLGASVVSHEFSYGDVDEWELAVIKFQSGEVNEDGEFELTYETPITGDVIGYLSWNEVEEYLEQIAAL